jgi:hypothetical protein
LIIATTAGTVSFLTLDVLGISLLLHHKEETTLIAQETLGKSQLGEKPTTERLSDMKNIAELFRERAPESWKAFTGTWR